MSGELVGIQSDPGAGFGPTPQPGHQGSSLQFNLLRLPRAWGPTLHFSKSLGWSEGSWHFSGSDLSMKGKTRKRESWGAGRGEGEQGTCHAFKKFCG